MTSIPDSVKQGISDVLFEVYKKKVALMKFSFAGGGCINQGGKLTTSEGSLFLKWNDNTRFPGMFKTEAEGLKILSEAKAIQIPEITGTGVKGNFQFLLLEFIDNHTPQKETSKVLGEQLANLHRCTQPYFGLDHNNYIGSLKQFNEKHTSWTDFFIQKRLAVQLTLGVDSGAIDISTLHDFERLYKKLPSLLPTEQPSLLHGDLWSGNLMTDHKGFPCLIDPAIYYGHREVDLAMTQLFGGFDQAFYSAYFEVFPVEPGFQERAHIYNLYPLLVHVNLFGGGYLRQVKNILNRLT